MIFIINSCIKKLLLEGNTFKPVKQHHIQWSVVKVPKFPPPPCLKNCNFYLHQAVTSIEHL